METTLPTIDISPFLKNDDETTSRQALEETAEELHRACCDTGFFYLIGHGIPPSELEEVIEVTRVFLLEGTEEEKARLSISKNDGARGYQRVGDNVTGGAPDWHEAVDFYAPSPFPNQHHGVLSGSNRFPTHPPHFQLVLESWIKRICSLGLVLMRATAMALKMSKDETENFLDLVRNSFWCIGYPPLPSTHAGVSCGAHKDYGCYTFLYTDSTRGSLQVSAPAKDEAGGYRWIEANPIEGAFVVNIGEMWETWTNGLYKATLHRVIHRSNNYRVSIPFFYEPNFDTVVAPLPAAIRIQENQRPQDQPIKIFKSSVNYGDFLINKISGNFSTEATGQKIGRY